MRLGPAVEIAEGEAGVIMRRTDHEYRKRIGGEGIAAEVLSPSDLRHAVEPDRGRADRLAGSGQAEIEAYHLRGGIHHRRDDLPVAGAAAQNTAQRILHLGLGRSGLRVQQRCRRDQQRRRADAALRRAVRQERGLQCRQPAVGQPFDGRHRCAGGRGRRHQAGTDGVAVDQHRAGAAITGVAADLGAGQLQFVTQHLG